MNPIMSPRFVDQYAHDRADHLMSAAQDHRRARVARDRRLRTKREARAADRWEPAAQAESAPAGWSLRWLARLPLALRRA